MTDQIQYTEGILLVSFGVSHMDTKAKTIGAFETLVAKAYPNAWVQTAYTSEMIRRKLARQTPPLFIPNTTEALESCIKKGIRRVIIQPTHLILGEEYHKMLDQIRPFRDQFESLKVGRPLLTDVDDYRAVVQAFTQAYPCASDELLVLMGHGTSYPIQISYLGLSDICRRMGYDHVLIGTIDGYPMLEDVVDEIKHRIKKGASIRRIHLAPLLFVAGEHAKEDMAGNEPNSWQSVLERLGISVESHIRGLGEFEAIQHIYLAHLQSASS